jgi:hypothetical protein
MTTVVEVYRQASRISKVIGKLNGETNRLIVRFKELQKTMENYQQVCGPSHELEKERLREREKEIQIDR